MIDYLIDIDTQVFLFFHNMRAPFLDAVMWIFSQRFVWVPMYAAILIFLFRRYDWRQALVFTVAVAITITLADQIGASCIRPYFARLRPSNLNNPLSAMVTVINGHRSGSYGFPSCHAANTFALATLISLIARNRALTIFLFIWAVVTCYSRVYLGVHYPGDLLAGAILGCICAIFVYYATARLSSRFLPSGTTYPRPCTILHHAPSHLIILIGTLTIIVIALISLWKA